MEYTVGEGDGIVEKLMSELKKNESGRVVKILIWGNMRRRLQDLGINVGRKVKCLGRSPSGGMGAYEILGAVMAIRDSECEKISLEQEGD